MATTRQQASTNTTDKVKIDISGELSIRIAKTIHHETARLEVSESSIESSIQIYNSILI